MAAPDGIDARLPLVTGEIVLGGRSWRVTAVQNQDALVEAMDSLEHMPYGFLLWEAAVGLAQLLCEQPERAAGKRILELGCGVGLPGMVARWLGAEVRQTDHQQGALNLAEKNALQNGITGIERFLADWRDWNHTERYDVLLGADILYERAMHAHLERIFRENLASGGTLLIGDPVRPQALEFTADLERKGWRMHLDTRMVRLHEEGRENRPVEVALIIGTPCERR
ncbi:MAG TPA: methyltransferase domain-containing protein [Chthonomonadaceae bacterium]|nr:methyltransferase domain-containing protein [Chthonomonadaceae bacterium]